MSSKKSRAEQDLFGLLCDEYPNATIICQQPIQCGRKTLFLDYYLPKMSLAFEADGRQHFEFVQFFHRSAEGFERSQANDRMKDEWCVQNKVLLIRFSDKEDVDSQTLRRKISEAVNGSSQEATPRRRRRKPADNHG